jgi:uncharacterized protein YcfL
MNKYVYPLIVVLFLLAGKSAFAQQVEYQEHVVMEELLIEYRWQPERLFQRSGNAVLNLQMTNLTESHLEVTFVVAFYKDGQIIQESDKNIYCFTPLQRRRAGRAGLRFMAEGITMDDIEKEEFSWDVLIEDIKEADECK